MSMGSSEKKWKALLDPLKTLKEVFGAVSWSVFRRWFRSRGVSAYRRALLGKLNEPEPPKLKKDLEPTLDQIYVPQSLIPEGGEQRVSLDVLSREEGVRALIRGEAGEGKTALAKTFLRRRILTLETQNRHDVLPVYLQLRYVIPPGTEPPEADSDIRKNRIFQKIGLELRQFVKHWAAEEEEINQLVLDRLNDGHLVLVLDGLDECGEAYDLAVQEIHRFCEKATRGNTIVVTCRAASYRDDLSAHLPDCYRIDKLTIEQVYEFLDKWPRCGEHRASDLRGRLENAPDALKFYTNPLRLTLVVKLYLESPSRDGQPFELPRSRSELYDRVFGHLLHERQRNRDYPSIFPAEGKRIILRKLAFEQFRGGAADPEKIDRAALARAIQAVLVDPVQGPGMGQNFSGLTEAPGPSPKMVGAPEAPPRLSPAGETLLDELERRDGLLRAASSERLGNGRPVEYEFAHRTFLEFLAAEYAAISRDVSPQWMLERFRRSEFNLLLSYASLCRSPDDVEVLSKGYRDEGRHVRVAEILLNAGASDKGLTDRVDYAVRGIVDTLMAQTLGQVEAGDHLRVLVGLAAREGAAYDPARSALASYVKSLAAGSAGDAELDGVLRSSPDHLIDFLWGARPVMTPQWRRALIRNLADRAKTPGGRVARGRLVDSLDDADPTVRHEAAVAMTKVLGEDPHWAEELVEEQPFQSVPEDEARAIWPLSPLFPAKIVAKLVKTASRAEDFPQAAIRCAFDASRAAPARGQDPWKLSYAHWRRDRRVVAGRGFLAAIVFLGAFLFDGAFMLQALRGVWTQQAYHFTFVRGFRTIPEGSIRWLVAFGEKGDRLIAEVRKKYPQSLQTSSSGTSIYTYCVDTVPKLESESFDRLKALANLDLTVDLSLSDLGVLEKIGCPKAELEEFAEARRKADPIWMQGISWGWRVPPTIIFKISGRRFWGATVLLLLTIPHLIFWGILVSFWGVLVGWDASKIGSFDGLPVSDALLLSLVVSLIWLFPYFCEGDWRTRLSPLIGLAAGLLVVTLVSAALRPRNPHLVAIDEFDKILRKGR